MAELDWTNWIALAAVLVSPFIAVWWSGRGARDSLKNKQPPAE